METLAPRSCSVFINFSASSFGTFSLSVWGHDSTNFFAWGLVADRGKVGMAWCGERLVGHYICDT